ncbi:hypothetical protein GJU39_00835 [Pedobacter petrophilus]|uniref:Uncharacterized protein n=1 Tax=Pedobacter petrophilus TaxID=1908241 RepID=A0A7K0FSN4_9SPHI|nr:hypothetical protein [Pedobacter petrophilus]MRX74617.1 hypothetical protein [Pedobacter petrophilus]
MKKLLFTLALATFGFFAQASTTPTANNTIDLTSNMVVFESVLSASEAIAKDVIYLGVYDVYVDGVYIGTYHVYLITN